MADPFTEGLTVEASGGLLTLPTPNERPASGVPDADDDFCGRVRAWFLEAKQAKVWKDWEPEADEDELFYIGGKGQWGELGDYTNWQRLKDKKRAIVTINHIQPIVDILGGYERANRMDIKANPQGDGDVEAAQLMSAFLKYAQDQTGTADVLSDMFDNGNIRGMDVGKVSVDYTGERPVNGEIEVKRLKPGKEILWDPHWTKYDFSDCRYMLEFKWAFVLDLLAEYPEHADRLRAAAVELRQAISEGKTTGRRGDNYGYVRSHPIENLDDEAQFYHAPDARMLVVEAWYHVYFTTFAVFDDRTGTTYPVEDFAAAARLRASDPTHMKIHRTETRKVRMATVVPAAYLTIEEDKNPHPNDDQNYPYVPYIAKRKGDVIYGVVRNLKDPQRLENKRWSQVADVLAKWADIRLMVPKGSVDNPQKLNDAGDDSPIVLNDVQGKGAPSFLIAPVNNIVAAIETLAKQMEATIRTISGINTDLLGQKADTSSGVAIARRQQQGQIIATVYFDNFKKTRRLFGQRLARRIQQVYTTEDVVRLTDEVGRPVLVRINPQNAPKNDEDFHAWAQAQEAAGKPKILRDVSSLKYEVVISEAPTTPTARAAALMALLEIAEKVPQIAPAVLDFIVELADVPNRHELIERVRRLIPPQLLGAPQPTPGNPGQMPEAAGTPPGQAPRPGGPPGPVPAGAPPGVAA